MEEALIQDTKIRYFAGIDLINVQNPAAAAVALACSFIYSR